MKCRYPITAQMIVKNEEYFVGFALESVASLIQNYIIYDTGSDDRTVEIIQNFIKSHPQLTVTFKQISITKPQDINRLRQEQCKATTTQWFLLLDGDEVWSKKQLKSLLQLTKSVSKNTIAVVNRTRECVGDIWHYLPDSFGRYELLREKGHLNIRLMRTLPYGIGGVYPNEGYYFQGRPVNTMDNGLIFSPSWYLHATHLLRSSKRSTQVFGRRKTILSAGKPMGDGVLPKVFFSDISYVPKDVMKKRSVMFTLVGVGADIIREITKGTPPLRSLGRFGWDDKQ